MNNAHKFHKANGPAFNPGELWKSANGGGIRATILSVRKFGDGKWDYEVEYQFSDGKTHKKDAWCFQVRYMHVADDVI